MRSTDMSMSVLAAMPCTVHLETATTSYNGQAPHATALSTSRPTDHSRVATLIIEAER
ncbi:hypothetical protein [Kitasatospora sp. NPDC057015]|uniref:hypothetical protein n=1 Tax=Kitasatospora sp. NPDC057015 TaxID=3346001 RepID=UPI0036262FCB